MLSTLSLTHSLSLPQPKMADSFSVSTFNTPGLRPSAGEHHVSLSSTITVCPPAAATSTPAVAGAPMGLHFDNVSLIQGIGR